MNYSEDLCLDSSKNLASGYPNSIVAYSVYCTVCIVLPVAEFLDVTGTKVFRDFLIFYGTIIYK